MKILMVLSNPFILDFRVYSEAKTLIEKGHQVTILAWNKKNLDIPKQEVKEKIQVVRSLNTRFMKTLPYDIFRMHQWWKKGYKDALNLHKKYDYDIIHCHDLDTLPLGVRLKKKTDLPLIYDAHEFWADMVAQDIPKTWSDYYRRIERKIIVNVDSIITVNEPLKEYLRRITDKKITIVMNCKPLQMKKYKPTDNDRFTLLYIGALLRCRYIVELIDVVKEISDIKAIIGGKGKPDFFEMIKNKSLEVSNIDFIGQVPMKKVIPMTIESDAVVCMTDPSDPNSSRALANKQFEAMVSARPIICTKNTYPGIFTEKYNVGITTDYDKESLKKAILKLKNNKDLSEKLGRNALDMALKEFNWGIQKKKLVRLYEEIK